MGTGWAKGGLAATWDTGVTSASSLAPLLKPGENVITATVWNWGVYAPVAQMSDRTAFLLESEATGSISISTPEGWRAAKKNGDAGRWSASP